jgi:hypothetical protein
MIVFFTNQLTKTFNPKAMVRIWFVRQEQAASIVKDGVLKRNVRRGHALPMLKDNFR